jgi:hypothetical protein
LEVIDTEGFRVAVGGIVDCIPVKVFGGSKDELIDVEEDKRFGSFRGFGIGVGRLDKVDV